MTDTPPVVNPVDRALPPEGYVCDAPSNVTPSRLWFRG
jgi:hypothetical protein